ncbi:shikimate dehydrogenase [Ruegeria faecimaris]|uniref:Shikimate dehydrogenase (NADP(+)) n=1 Tax=Ruegeria faecimaris TaxID=686389 RepID=A0A521DJW3_9RHOB|nr:shikimate dehydrogenase [Ruegeria faecimaris]SMO71381.1 shikimate dehydrogenase [Ruegeria faecimaris]
MSGKQIPLAGVIGHPISHSKSPILHGHWLKTYGLAGHYIPMDVAPDDLEAVLRTLPKAGFVGANITVPHKEVALDLADTASDRARQIGAANTLVFQPDGSIHADNTDGYGFMQNLRSGAPDWIPADGPAVVFGAGGAARAVLQALVDAGVPEILLTNRTRSRADRLKEEFGTTITVVDWLKAGNVVEDAELVVNTSSLGMHGQPELRVPLDGLQPGAVVTDLVYAPLKTRLLETAEQAGCTPVDGLGMLLHQAVPGFESWFGVRPEVTSDLRAAVLG